MFSSDGCVQTDVDFWSFVAPMDSPDSVGRLVSARNPLLLKNENFQKQCPRKFSSCTLKRKLADWLAIGNHA